MGYWEKQPNSKKEKADWEKVGFWIANISEESRSSSEPGELEILLNNLLGVCPDQGLLAFALKHLDAHPGLKGFALTVDTVLKMTALYIRINSGVPTVLMGESGCGKSAVIRYLALFCDISAFVLDVHGGLAENDIVEFVSEAVAAAFSNPAGKVWVFLDEINTASCVGLFRELVCDRSMKGTALPPNLRPSRVGNL